MQAMSGRLQREIWQWQANLEAARSYDCRAEIMEAYAMIARLRQCQRTIRAWATKDWDKPTFPFDPDWMELERTP
jgi:hypothetical protein